MKMANSTRSMTEYKASMEGVKYQVMAIAQNPDLLQQLTITPKDQAVQEKLASMMQNVLEVAQGTSTVVERESREAEALRLVGVTTPIELEDGEIFEDEIEEEVLAVGMAPRQIASVDLEAPSPKKVVSPPLEARLRSIASDMACAFLFHQKKHNRSWLEASLSFFMGTSRKV